MPGSIGTEIPIDTETRENQRLSLLFLVGRAGLEPIGPKINRNLLILLIGKNAQIVPYAYLRYTAGTGATNSLVDSGGENDRNCVTHKTREPVPEGEHCYEIAARGSNRI